jgi:hypothetical protein
MTAASAAGHWVRSSPSASPAPAAPTAVQQLSARASNAPPDARRDRAAPPLLNPTFGSFQDLSST